MQTTIGFIGAGKMAEAMIGALLYRQRVRACDLLASDIMAERRRDIERNYGITVTNRNTEVATRSGIIFLAVKPQQLDEVLKEIAPVVDSSKLVISIAAGKRLATMESRLPNARVVRVMPNLPCLVAEGMSVFCAGSRATPADRQTVLHLLTAFGRVAELPEEQFDAVTALSGSGPAFFAYFLDCLVLAAEAVGLDRETALLLAAQTMLGTARLVLEKALSPDRIIESVSSARGTTVAGMAVIGTSDVPEVVRRTIEAATRRSRELSSQG
ncbi:MAG: pyrroline-5-carboxylate reductase [Kiritimatiellae bacterium]|nr:pyrroline-5-carboxylate reductase [Kiritimatiellia bacterium]